MEATVDDVVVNSAMVNEKHIEKAFEIAETCCAKGSEVRISPLVFLYFVAPSVWYVRVVWWGVRRRKVG